MTRKSIKLLKSPMNNLICLIIFELLYDRENIRNIPEFLQSITM